MILLYRRYPKAWTDGSIDGVMRHRLMSLPFFFQDSCCSERVVARFIRPRFYMREVIGALLSVLVL